MINRLIPEWLHLPHREDNIFSIVFLIFLAVPLVFIPILPEGYETVKYAFLVFLTGVGTLVLLSRKQIQSNKSVLGLLILLWLLHLVSTIFSLDILNSVVGLYGRYTGSLYFITSWVLLIILIWNAVKQDETRRMTLLRVLVFDSLAVSVLGILQYFDFAYYGGVNPGIRSIIPSFIGNQNFFGMFLVGVLPAIVLLGAQAKGKVAQYYYILVGVISLWALILSGSRGALLGFGAMSLVLLFTLIFRKFPKKAWIGVMGMIVTAGLFYGAFFALTRSNSVEGVAAAQQTTQTRYIIWADSLKVIAQSPVVGTGSGNFFIAFEKLRDITLAGSERFDDAHNLFLNIAATTGLPALAVFLVIIGLSFLLAWRESEYFKSSSVWVIAAAVGVLVAACFNPVSISIWLIIALIIAFASSNSSVTRGLKTYWKIILGITSVVIIIFSTCFLTSDILSVYGLRAYRKHNDALAEKYYKPAVLLNPFNTSAIVHLTSARINLKTDLDQRINDIEAIVDQHPNSAGNYRTAGDLTYRLYVVTKEEAIKVRMNELYEKAIELEPGSTELYSSAAYAFYKTNQSDKAMEFLDRQQSKSDSREYPYLWILRSAIYFERGQQKETIDSFERAYRLMTDQVVFKYFLRDLRSTTDMKTLRFPVTFPDIDV